MERQNDPISMAESIKTAKSMMDWDVMIVERYPRYRLSFKKYDEVSFMLPQQYAIDHYVINDIEFQPLYGKNENEIERFSKEMDDDGYSRFDMFARDIRNPNGTAFIRKDYLSRMHVSIAITAAYPCPVMLFLEENFMLSDIFRRKSLDAITMRSSTMQSISIPDFDFAYELIKGNGLKLDPISGVCDTIAKLKHLLQPDDYEREYSSLIRLLTLAYPEMTMEQIDLMYKVI